MVPTNKEPVIPHQMTLEVQKYEKIWCETLLKTHWKFLLRDTYRMNPVKTILP